MKNDTHISDEDLLRAVDGELSQREGARVREHLKACWECRTRRSKLEHTIEEFIAAHRGQAQGDLPPIEGPRALLRARLGQLQASEPQNSWQRLKELVFQTRAPFHAGLGLALVGIVGLTLYLGVQQVRAASTPDLNLTPGATRTVTKDDVCAARPDEGFYPIPATLAYRVFEKYGIRNPQPRSYEVDYLITPALGGADDIRNLWPQPFAAGEWNAHVKDALEDYLHQQVCSGKVELHVAQRDIAENWIAAYRKYFHTDHPLPIHTNFSIDAPWED